jgi:hypothetical protein
LELHIIGVCVYIQCTYIYMSYTVQNKYWGSFILTPLITFNLGMSDYCLTPNEQFFSYTMARTNYIQWDDDDIHFVLDEHA